MVPKCSQIHIFLKQNRWGSLPSVRYPNCLYESLFEISNFKKPYISFAVTPKCLVGMGGGGMLDPDDILAYVICYRAEMCFRYHSFKFRRSNYPFLRN